MCSTTPKIVEHLYPLNISCIHCYGRCWSTTVLSCANASWYKFSGTNERKKSSLPKDFLSFGVFIMVDSDIYHRNYFTMFSRWRTLLSIVTCKLHWYTTGATLGSVSCHFEMWSKGDGDRTTSPVQRKFTLTSSFLCISSEKGRFRERLFFWIKVNALHLKSQTSFSKKTKKICTDLFQYDLPDTSINISWIC